MLWFFICVQWVQLRWCTLNLSIVIISSLWLQKYSALLNICGNYSLGMTFVCLRYQFCYVCFYDFSIKILKLFWKCGISGFSSCWLARFEGWMLTIFRLDFGILPTVWYTTFLPTCPFGLVARIFSCPKAGNTCPNFLTCKTR
jgi:hypothetical protein